MRGRCTAGGEFSGPALARPALTQAGPQGRLHRACKQRQGSQASHVQPPAWAGGVAQRSVPHGSQRSVPLATRPGAQQDGEHDLQLKYYLPQSWRAGWTLSRRWWPGLAPPQRRRRSAPSTPFTLPASPPCFINFGALAGRRAQIRGFFTRSPGPTAGVARAKAAAAEAPPAGPLLQAYRIWVTEGVGGHVVCVQSAAAGAPWNCVSFDLI